MKYEIGKYYRLNPNKYYWCIDIQRSVKFQEPPIIRLEHFFMDKPAYGKLIQHEILGDVQTNVEIAICEKDIMNEYQFQEYNMPLFYIDLL